jgi:hypothetical protein
MDLRPRNEEAHAGHAPPAATLPAGIRVIEKKEREVAVTEPRTNK